jgi:hypothetical protein
LLPIRTLTRIQNNRDRLNQSELRYRETDPKKNPNWANLDAQAEIVEDLRHREQNAKDALKGVYDKAIGRGGVPMVPAAFKDIDSNPEQSRELILQFYQQVTGPNWKRLEPQFTRYANELYLATKVKHAMYETEPALAVVSAEYMDQLPPTTPQNTRKIQQVMTEGFAPMRDSMGKLEQAIRGDKSGNTAFELDRVVEGTLADIKDPQQRQKVAEWIADKRKREQDQRLLGNVLTGLSVLGGAGAGLLGFARTAWVLGGTASALFGATTLQDLRQTGLVLDGAQGQGPGNQRLTSADVNQAQTAYYTNYVNVAFLLLEGGMTVKSVVGLLQERRALETLAKLTPVERGEFAQAAQLQQAGKTAEAEGRLQKIRKQVGEEVYKKIEACLRLVNSNPEAGMVRMPGGEKGNVAKQLEAKGVPKNQAKAIENRGFEPKDLDILIRDGVKSEDAAALLIKGIDKVELDKLIAKGLANSKGTWVFDPSKDLDWRGGQRSFQQALDEAYQRTGVPREYFKPTKRGYDKYGKSHPTELVVPKDPSIPKEYWGAEVNVDLPLDPAEKGPLVPHVGYRTSGKGKSQERGHILLDDVPYNRGKLTDEKR